MKRGLSLFRGSFPCVLFHVELFIFCLEGSFAAFHMEHSRFCLPETAERLLRFVPFNRSLPLPAGRKKRGQPTPACNHCSTKKRLGTFHMEHSRRFLQPPAFAGDSFVSKVFTCGSFSRPTFAGEPFTYEFFTYEKSIASPCPFLPCPLGALLTAGLFAVQRPVQQPFSRLQVARPNGPFAFPPRSEHLPQEELFTGMRTRYSI